MSKIIKGKLYTNPLGLIVKATSNSDGANFDGILIEDPNNDYPHYLNKNSKFWNTYYFEEYNPNNDLFPIY